MNTAYSYMVAGVKLVPESQKVQADLPLFLLILTFFTYLGVLLWRSSKEP
jgi:hypothetical protein